MDAWETVKNMDTSALTPVQIAELIYKEAFGIEHIFGGQVTTGRELVCGDTDNDYNTKGVDNMGIFNDTWYWESSNKTSVSWMPNYNTSAAAQMIAPGLYGGNRVYNSSYNKNNRNETQNRYQSMGDGVLRSRYMWEGRAYARVYAFTARTAYNGGQACDALVARPCDGMRIRTLTSTLLLR